MTKKQWVTCQHQLPVTTPHSFPGQTLSSLPAQASCDRGTTRPRPVEGSTQQRTRAGSSQPLVIQTSGCLLNKDHQLSPHSVPDIVENPMNKWRLQQDHLFYIFKIKTKFHHFMNETWVPETCPYLPTCPPGSLMEQVTESL